MNAAAVAPAFGQVADMTRYRSPRDPDRAVLTPAMRRNLVERRIVEAMERGEFDNLPGEGKPVHIDTPPPVNEDLWWMLKIMRQANVVPDEIRYRKRIDDLRQRLDAATDERQVIAVVRELNEQIRKLNRMGTNVIPTTLTTFDEADALAQWRRRAGASGEGPSHANDDGSNRV